LVHGGRVSEVLPILPVKASEAFFESLRRDPVPLEILAQRGCFIATRLPCRKCLG